MSRVLLGRRIIKTEFGEITRANVVDVLKKAFTVHLRNKIDIEYLYRYYCGFQPILYREKEVRPEINNKIVENRALEIVAFRVGYNMGEPVQYVSRGDDKSVAQGVSQLNDYVTSEEKEAEDRLLCEWAQICGTSFRMVLPDAQVHEDKDEAPFEIFTLDPRYTFVVYQNALGTPPVMAVTYIEKSKSRRVFSVYREYRTSLSLLLNESSHRSDSMSSAWGTAGCRRVMIQLSTRCSAVFSTWMSSASVDRAKLLPSSGMLPQRARM